jgi:hypothetical protein
LAEVAAYYDGASRSGGGCGSVLHLRSLNAEEEEEEAEKDVDSGARGQGFGMDQHSCMLRDDALRARYAARITAWLTERLPLAGKCASFALLDIGAGPYAVQGVAGVRALAAALAAAVQRRPVRGGGGGGGRRGVGHVFVTIVTVEKDREHSSLAAAAVHAAIRETGLHHFVSVVEVVELPGFLGDPLEHQQLGEAAAAGAAGGGGGVGSSAEDDDVLPALRLAVRRAAADADARTGVPGSLHIGVFHELFGA